MALQFQSPLKGGPKTVETRDSAGCPVYTTTDRLMTPRRMKVVDKIGDFVKVVLWLTGATMAWQLYTTNRLTQEAAIALVIGLVAVFYGLRAVLRLVFKKRFVLRQSVEANSVRGWLGWKHYERAVRHSFVVLPHDLTDWEQQTNDLTRRKAAQKGYVIQPRTYYGYSGHVSLVYAGHRVDLVEVFDTRNATPLVSRAQYCDEMLDVFQGKTRGPDEGAGWAAPEPGAWQS